MAGDTHGDKTTKEPQTAPSAGEAPGEAARFLEHDLPEGPDCTCLNVAYDGTLGSPEVEEAFRRQGLAVVQLDSLDG